MNSNQTSDLLQRPFIESALARPWPSDPSSSATQVLRTRRDGCRGPAVRAQIRRLGGCHAGTLRGSAGEKGRWPALL